MRSTRVTQLIRAPRQVVYAALLDPKAIAQWRVPDEMSSEIHQFEDRVGGKFRVSLTYRSEDQQGKTTSHTDTYHGHFVELVPNEKVVEAVEFETNDPGMKGVMTLTTILKDTKEGTLLEGIHDGLPPALSPEDNEIGWRHSLEKLAKLLDQG